MLPRKKQTGGTGVAVWRKEKAVELAMVVSP